VRPHFHLWPVQPQAKEFRYWRRPYVDLIEFRPLKPSKADVLFLGAVDGIVDSNPVDQVEFVVIASRVRVSGLDNREHPSDVKAFNTELFREFTAQRDHRRFARLDVAARKEEPRLTRRLGQQQP
jgi:hypothetical protein